LTLTGTTLDVVAGSGISVAADAVAVDSTVVRTTRTVMAGSGLTGGGALSSDLTLNVGAGTLITVGADTVGITTGANYQYIGTGSGTAAAWQNLSGLAGAGLTHSAGVFAVGAGNGITVNADDVALTTPGTLTVSSTNSASGSHTHAVTSSSNPGAAASILASTAAGGLTLQSLAVRGSVDITDGGDLTVAGSGDYAGYSVLFVDSSGGNVGIMGAPDPQFALDIVGPARASYWIGPHAIQIKDVTLLAHYDGKAPFATNYTGEPNGHMGQVPVMSGGLIFRPGKFGKAAQFGESTINLVVNPSLETNATGWSAVGAASVNRSSTQALYGTYSLACTAAGSGQGGKITVAGLTANAGHTASAYVFCESQVTISIHATDGIDLDLGVTAVVVPAATWTRIVRTFVTDTHTTITLDITVNTATTFYVDGVQVERKDYATPYCDGSLGGYDGAGVMTGAGHQWTGTIHGSTSGRSEARLYYMTPGNVNLKTGTMMCWIYCESIVPRSLFVATDNGGLAVVAGNGTLDISRKNTEAVLGAAQAWAARTWYHVAVTWEGRAVTAYVNGVQVGQATATGDFVTPAAFYVGRWLDDYYNLNGLMDDFVLVGRVLPDSEILSIYASDAPVFAETSRFSFRATPQGLVWADDEGLWMRNTAGSAVLGAYGGSATKSWAGITLGQSDIVIGDGSRGGYVKWDDSAATLSVLGTITATTGAIGGWTLGANSLIAGSGANTVGLDSGGTNPAFYAGNATPLSAPFFVTKAGALTATNATISGEITASSGSITGFLTIGTSGGIYQGTGTSGSPTTGLKIWNDGGVGRIGGYNSGNLQWYASTSGYFYSGSGTMRIGSDDIRLQLGTYDGDYDDYRFIRWLPSIDASDTAITDSDYRAHITAWATTATQDKVTLQMSSRVNAGDYDSRQAETLVAANNWNGSALNYAELAVIQKDSGDNYLGVIRMIQNVLEIDLNSDPTGNPGAGLIWVWFTSGTTMKTRDSAGTTRSITFA
jgi:hypothetical protein